MRRLTLLLLSLVAAVALGCEPVPDGPPPTSTTSAPPTTTSTSTTSTPSTIPPPPAGWPTGLTWQWQISGTVDQTVDAQVFDVDGFDATAALVAGLHANGRRVVCYLDMGSAENYRPDYGDFAPSALSTTNQDWPDEKWIHPAALDAAGTTGKTVRQLLTARVLMVHAKGCDAVEPDMIEAASNNVTFPQMPKATAGEQLAFNRWIADTVHGLGMAVALKGDRDQADDLEPWFDFAIQEEEYAYGEQHATDAFLAAGKAVLDAEYKAPLQPVWCTDARARGISLIGKKLSLGAPRTLC